MLANPAAEGGTMGEKWPRNFAEKCNFHVTFEEGIQLKFIIGVIKIINVNVSTDNYIYGISI
jgi:hypothetical protein